MREVGMSGGERCPVDRGTLSQQKTARVVEPAEPDAVERGADGSVARALSRAGAGGFAEPGHQAGGVQRRY